MKLLVTGAKGQVGSALCRVAKRYRLDVTALDSSDLNITRAGDIQKSLDNYQPDFIVNAAAYTAVDNAESDADNAELVNAVAVGYLAEVAATRKIPLIHISTDYVFDGTKSGAYLETDATNPLGVYGKTKLHGELLVRKHNEKHIILRTSWVFGLEGKNFPKTMLRLALENRPQVAVVADQIGCPTFADDIALAILEMVLLFEQSGRLPWGVYHYAGLQQCSWYDFANAIFESALERGLIKNKPALKSLRTSEYPSAARRPANSVLNCQKFSAAFPAISLSDWQKGIDRLVESMRA